MADTTVTKRIPKPKWERIQHRMLYRAIFQGIALGTAGMLASYFLWYKPKWDKTEEYERNYNPFAEMERMRNLGIFSSAPPDYVLEERKKKAAANK